MPRAKDENVMRGLFKPRWHNDLGQLLWPDRLVAQALGEELRDGVASIGQGDTLHGARGRLRSEYQVAARWVESKPSGVGSIGFPAR